MVISAATGVKNGAVGCRSDSVNQLLYRGFLMLVLTPGAVILAALAYGAGHGYKSRGQFAGSIVSAFLFTIGYVLTGSLWWLMLLHMGLPLFGLISSSRARKAAQRLGLAR
jgi:membrane protease YdiL (CAAX protease family)